MTSSSHLELTNELRVTLLTIGLDDFSSLVKPAPGDSRSEIDSALLDKLLDLLSKLLDEEALPYDQVDESKVINEHESDDSDPMYYTQILVEEEESATDSASDEPPIFDEVKISDTAFPELFPTEKTTNKKELPKSFPNIDEFDGGIHMLGSGNFGYTFKSVLHGVPVVLKVSKTRSEESNRADYHEWSVSEKLKPHPNVLQIIGLCPSFAWSLHTGLGTTALIAPLQENGGLRRFFFIRIHVALSSRINRTGGGKKKLIQD